MRIEDLRVVLDTDNTRLMRTRPVSLADLVEVLKDLGAVIDTSGEVREWENGVTVNGPRGSRFLVLPLGDTP